MYAHCVRQHTVAQSILLRTPADTMHSSRTIKTTCAKTAISVLNYFPKSRFLRPPGKIHQTGDSLFIFLRLVLMSSPLIEKCKKKISNQPCPSHHPPFSALSNFSSPLTVSLHLSSPSSRSNAETIINYPYPSLLSFPQSSSIFPGPIQQSGSSWLAGGHPTPSLSVTLLLAS